MFSRFQLWIHEWLHSPMRVLLVGALVTFMLLLVDGSLWRFWSLQRGQEEMLVRMEDLEKKAKALEFKIHQSENLTYIERQATDQFDYVREGDLIFVFNE